MLSWQIVLFIAAWMSSGILLLQILWYFCFIKVVQLVHFHRNLETIFFVFSMYVLLSLLQLRTCTCTHTKTHTHTRWCAHMQRVRVIPKDKMTAVVPWRRIVHSLSRISVCIKRVYNHLTKSISILSKKLLWLNRWWYYDDCNVPLYHYKPNAILCA